MSSRSQSILIFFIVTLGPLLWAGNFVVARSLHDSIEPFQLNYLRWVVAGLILLPITVRDWQHIAAAWASHPLQILTLGALSVALFNCLVYSGLQHSSASTGGAIFALSALFILFISRIWRGTRLRAREVLGASVAFLGAGLVIQQDVNGLLSQEDLRGPLLLIAGSFVWALYTVCLRRWSVPLTPSACLATTVFSGLLIMTPFAIIAEMPTASMLADPAVFGGILYVGIGASVLAFCAWQKGVATLGAARAGVFLNLVPVFTLILGVLVLKEALTPQKVTGVFMVLLGVLLSRTGNNESIRSSVLK